MANLIVVVLEHIQTMFLQKITFAVLLILLMLLLVHAHICTEFQINCRGRRYVPTATVHVQFLDVVMLQLDQLILAIFTIVRSRDNYRR